MTKKIDLDVNLLYERHKNGESITSIAKNLGVNKSTITRRFKEKNLKTHYKQSDIYNTQYEKIHKMYIEGNSCSDIGKKLEIPHVSVWRVLKQNKVKLKSTFDYREKLRKYNINDENYFSKIDTEVKAYILGFLYADGNAHKKHYHIKLKLQEKDKNILERMKKEIGIDNTLHFSQKTKASHQNQYSLIISNKVIYHDLMSHGIVPNKTFILTFPYWLDKKLNRHFIRGYFDGDGSIYVGKTWTSSLEWMVMGTTKMCESIRDILREEASVEKCVIQHEFKCTEGIDRLRVRSRKNILKIFSWMYRDSDIYLKRKFDKFLKIKGANNVNLF